MQLEKKNGIKVAALCVMVLLACLFFLWNFEEIKQVFAIRISALILLSGLVLSTQLMNGVRLRILTVGLGLRLRPKEWVGMAVVQSFLNYLPLKGGMVANAYYLKKRHDFSYANFICMMSASVVITLLTSGLIGFLTAGYYALTVKTNMVVPGIFLVFILTALAFMLFSARRVVFGGTLQRKLGQVLEGWQIMRERKRTLLLLMVLDILSILIFSLRYFITFRAFSSNIPWLSCVILAPLSISSTLVSFTPAGLGIREGVVGLASRILGGSLNIGIYSAALDRAVVMCWVFVVAPIFGYILLRTDESSSNKKAPVG